MRILALCCIILSACGAVMTAPAAPPKPTTDSRLAQPVTIECTGMRLHSVLDQISAKTGVKLFSGSSKKDWPVRDLPVLVSVRDMPLGRLLKDIAYVTRLDLGSEKLDKEICYRIYQSAANKKALEAYYQARRDTASAQAKWAWDTAAQLHKIPESELDLKKMKSDGGSLVDSSHDAFARDVSQILDTLGTKTRDKVLAGTAVYVTLEDAPSSIRDSIKHAALYAWQQRYDEARRNNWPAGTSTEPSEDGLTGVSLQIRFDSIYDRPIIRVYVEEPMGYDNITPGLIAGSLRIGTGNRFAAEPEMPQPPGAQPVRSFWWVMTNADLDWPTWKQRVTIEAPKDKKNPTRGDALAALAKVADINIVSEDTGSYRDTPITFGKDLAVRDIVMPAADKWHVDDDQKTILGMLYDIALWHQSLIPESTYNDLCSKANGAGITFEDALPTCYLSEMQSDIWLESSLGLKPVNGSWRLGKGADKPLWQLYASLSVTDQAQAETPKGLRLSGLDPKVVAEVILSRVKSQRSLGFPQAMVGVSDQEALAKDQDALSRGTLLLVSEERGGKTFYHLEIKSPPGDKPVLIRTQDAGGFPAYSSAGEAELINQAARSTPAPPSAVK